MLERYKIFLKKDLVLVYQFGKVGSTSICNGLRYGLNVHDLYGRVTCPPGFKYRFGFLYKFFFPLDRLLRRLLIRRRREVKIIVPLREPAERNISMFFQDLPFWYVKYFSENKGYAKSEGIQILKEIFDCSFPHDACDDWFENEFSRFTGIKFEDIAFDVNAGVGYAEKGKYKCLFVHHDKITSGVVRSEIHRVTGEQIGSRNVNRGGEKWYGAAYKEFMSSEDYVESYKVKMRNTKVYSKFYAS